jgi:hypothetical protein
MKLMIYKDGEWQHATKEDLEQFRYPKMKAIYLGGEWRPIEVLLKESGNNGN